MDRFLEQSQTQSKPDKPNTLALETHVTEFFVWFKTYFVEYLQCQHEVKATVLLPLLNLSASTKQQILGVYQDIAQMLTQIQQLERALCEATLHPAMSAAFTEHAFQSHIMPRVFRSIRSKRVVVPWIVERSKMWGGVAEQRTIQGMLPFSAKFLYRKIWRPYFMSNVAVAMKNLDEFVSSTDSNSHASNSSLYSERNGEMCSIM
ncbi:hypothetical protein BBJ29_004793 [Phytophthora kernoviae]|uniref:Uncharacterized protein n=1 Tax=Phytophthora kernoviae TaxID=325452 RepID=A0A3F2S0R4_9STRA|nr:hypothetical protein BBJ29_004793 [Phytophthora kernoviae]RLN68093.1 hypothetical protein BBP00_00001226 [Phytophthora kernoviae]